MEVIVAVDIGTTEAKCSLVDRQGHVLARAAAGYPLFQDGPRHEQDPADWWRATQEAVRTALAAVHVQPAAIVLSGQMQDCILIGDSGPLAPTLLYSDTRAAAEAALIERRIGSARLQAVTGNLQDASSLPAKLLWLRDHAPESYAAAHTLFIGAHDYIAWQLCGARAADYTTASTTGLLDLHANQWALDVLETLGLRTDWLPQLTPATAIVGHVHAAAAQACGLPVGTPVIHGAGDVATTTIGSGAGAPGRRSIYLGTTGWLATTSTAAPVDPTSGIFNLRHANPDQLILVGPMLTAAGNLAWLREQFGGLEAPGGSAADMYAQLTALAASAVPGCRGLLYLPYLAGERSPFREPHARGVFFGLDRTTTRQEIYRAVLEGVAFAMRSISAAMPAEAAAGAPVVHIVGGGARSAVWPQIFADVLGCEVRVLAEPQDVGARGAALIAAQTLGWQTSFAAEAYAPSTEVLYPQPDLAAMYAAACARYDVLVEAMRPLFGRMALPEVA